MVAFNKQNKKKTILICFRIQFTFSELFDTRNKKLCTFFLRAAKHFSLFTEMSKQFFVCALCMRAGEK